MHWQATVLHRGSRGSEGQPCGGRPCEDPTSCWADSHWRLAGECDSTAGLDGRAARLAGLALHMDSHPGPRALRDCAAHERIGALALAVRPCEDRAPVWCDCGSCDGKEGRAWAQRAARWRGGTWRSAGRQAAGAGPGGAVGGRAAAGRCGDGA